MRRVTCAPTKRGTATSLAQTLTASVVSATGVYRTYLKKIPETVTIGGLTITQDLYDCSGAHPESCALNTYSLTSSSPVQNLIVAGASALPGTSTGL